MSCDRKLSPFAIAVLGVSALGANVALAEPEQGFPNDSRYSWNNVTIVAGGFITGIVPNTAFQGRHIRSHRYRRSLPLRSFLQQMDSSQRHLFRNGLEFDGDREHCRRSRPALAGLQ
jgi:hypothetical protein